MQTIEETVTWLIFLQREDFSTTFTDSSSCSILSKASSLSSRRVLVKLQLLKKTHLRAILCRNQAKWEMKNFDPQLKFACK